MGLLDDAIRDHLELKRRHGADPSEVERQEQEALGPARREAAEPVGAVSDDGQAAFDQELEDEYDPRPGDEIIETTDEEEPVYDEDLIGEGDEEELLPDEEPVREESVGPPTTAAHEIEELQRARERADEHDDRDDAVPAGEEPDEDVLEETPEFLQETPEHDRLWFEQKPPRDFEF
jgi:hypothetical protein